MVTERIRWKTICIDGEDTRYEVSNTGDVRNKETRRVLKAVIQTNGYCYVTLCNKGNRKDCTIHSLVLRAFVKDYDSSHSLECNHKDSNKENNNLDNLELVTPKENTIHRIRSGNQTIAKLNEKKVRMIRRLYESGITQKQLSKTFGVHRDTIARVCRRASWGFVS